MKLDKFRGVFPAQIVPFASGNTIDEGALRRLVRLNMGKGVNGFYVCGSTGETFLMTLEERKRVLEIVKDEVAERCTVIAHIGAISTDQSIELARHAAETGADAISSAAPFYHQFSRQEIIDHYLAIVRAVSFPMIIYNIPATTGVSFSLEELQRLLQEEWIIGVKHTSRNLYVLERLKRLAPGRVILFGYDEMSLPAYSVGADGSIGSTFNLMPEKFLRIRSLFEQGKLAEARELQSEANAVIQALIQSGLFAAIKYGITRLGIEYGSPRRPFAPLTPEKRAYLDDIFDRYL